MEAQQSDTAHSSDFAQRTEDLCCRFCGAALTTQFVDLGMSPLCQTQIEPSQLNNAEVFYPLRVFVCSECYLVQLDEYVKPDTIFSAEYPYYSSFSDSWVAHARSYVDHVKADLGIGSDSFVVEIASNDGYLLQHFVDDGVRCLGIEPAAGVAEAAREKGVNTLNKFFGTETAEEVVRESGRADLLLGNNVLAHVPDLNDFVSGLARLLAAEGVVTMEFPHLLQLMQQNQFDTIYHEHFSYLSFSTVSRVFAAHGLRMIDVAELPTHGGSIRIYAAHEDSAHSQSTRVTDLLTREDELGMNSLGFYTNFEPRVRRIKNDLLRFLIDARDSGKTVVGYGAPGKGNTLLNYCGIRTDYLAYTVDRNPHKQGTYTPGTRIPIHDPSRIFETRPDYIVILPWNLRTEISTSMAGVAEWGCKFVVPIPSLEIFDSPT